jgi:MFS family permease
VANADVRSATPRGELSVVLVVAVATVAIGAGSILGFLAGFVGTAIREDLGLDRWHIGLLVSVHFGCTGLGSITAGRITDAVGARLSVVIDLALVMTVGVLVAIIGTYWMLIVAAVVAGFGYALANTGTNVAVARVVSVERRTVALSIKTGGIPAMTGISAAVGPWAADAFSWQAITAALCIGAGLVGVACFFVLPDDRPMKGVIIHRRLPRGFGWFPVAAFLLIAGSQPMYSWSVPYLEEEFSTSARTAGLIVAMSSFLGVAVMVLNGIRSDRVGPGRRIAVVITLCGIVGAANLLAVLGIGVGIGLAIVAVVAGIAFQLAAIGTVHAAVVDRAGPAVARATGVTMTGYYLGALASPVAFGALVDWTGGYSWPWFLLMIVMLLAGTAFVFAGRVEPPAGGDLRTSR